MFGDHSMLDFPSLAIDNEVLPAVVDAIKANTNLTHLNLKRAIPTNTMAEAVTGALQGIYFGCSFVELSTCRGISGGMLNTKVGIISRIVVVVISHMTLLVCAIRFMHFHVPMRLLCVRFLLLSRIRFS